MHNESRPLKRPLHELDFLRSVFMPGLRLGIAQVSLEFVQDAHALGGVFLFGDQPLFEEVGQASEAGGEVLFQGSHP